MKRITLLLFLLFIPVLSSDQRQIAMAQTGRTNDGEIGYRMVRVRRTRILFPRLTSFRDRAIMNAVNRRIDELTAEFGCQGEGGKNATYKVRSRVEYTAKDIFSIYASSEYYCGTAYPTNDNNVSLTFDMKTGKTVNFEDLFKNYEADRQEIIKTIFAGLLARGARAAASGKPKDGNCEELYNLDTLESATYVFNFSKTGLSVQADWPHVMESCAERVAVPYTKLSKFAAPDGLLARVLK
ncbi:MAG: hypothetical protein H0W99_10725 [Acidobacteria bacterium]|nr:hypothetical protein [Acidobacteriota bacterium]